MARGGLAGIWDRNKKWLTPVAEGLVGMIPGVGVPLAAGLGAAIGGLDRPGQRGIGLDLGGAVKGGISGYGMGKLGGGLKGMFAPSAVTSAGTTAASQPLAGEGALDKFMPKPTQFAAPGISTSAGDYAVDTSFIPKAVPKANTLSQLLVPSRAAATAPSAEPFSGQLNPLNALRGASSAAAPVSTGPAFSGLLDATKTLGNTTQQAGGNWWDKGLGKLNSAVEWGEKHPKVAEAAIKGISGALPNAQSAAMSAQAKVAQDRLALEKQQYDDEIKRRQQIAQLLNPMARSLFPSYYQTQG